MWLFAQFNFALQGTENSTGIRDQRWMVQCANEANICSNAKGVAGEGQPRLGRLTDR